MAGALPDTSNGAVQNRDALGACINPAGVVNAYCPPATFTSNCALTALPNNCTGKIVPGQINGIVSELMCFAVTLNPDGNWDCGSLCNLAANFQAWAAENKLVDGTTIIGAGTVADPWHISPTGAVSAICADHAAASALATCVISTQAGNDLIIGSDGLLYVPPINPDALAAAICADDSAADALAVCVREVDPNNMTIIGPGGRLLTPLPSGPTLANQICSSPVARQALSSCVRSADANNALVTGTDGLLFVSQLTGDDVADQVTIGGSGAAGSPFAIIPIGTVNAICADAAANTALRECLMDSTPAAPACADPVEFMGRDAGGTLLRYQRDEIMAFGRNAAVAQLPTTFALDAVVGSTVWYTSAVSTITNANTCRSLNAAVVLFASLTQFTIGNGDVTITTEASLNGAAFQTYAVNRYSRLNANATEQRRDILTLIDSQDILVAPSTASTVQFRISITVTTAFGAGSQITNFGTIATRVTQIYR